MHFFIRAAIAASLLTACQAGTIYKEATRHDQIGFTSGQTEDGRHYVTLRGHPRSRQLEIYTLAFKHALEVAEADGAVGIEVIGQLHEKQRVDPSQYIVQQIPSGAGRGTVMLPGLLALEFRIILDLDAYQPTGGVVIQSGYALDDIEATLATRPRFWR